MKPITLGDLYATIVAHLKEHKGDANKVILVADDDEGNGYHPIYFALTPMDEVSEEDIACCNLYGISAKDAVEKCIILG